MTTTATTTRVCAHCARELRTTTKRNAATSISHARYCSEECALAAARSTHGGAREGAGPKTLASKGLEARDKRVTVRFSAQQLAQLEAAADADGVSIAEYIAARALA